MHTNRRYLVSLLNYTAINAPLMIAIRFVARVAVLMAMKPLTTVQPIYDATDFCTLLG